MAKNETIISERVRILFDRSFYSSVTVILAAIIFAYLMRAQLNNNIMYLWLSYMFIVSLYRFWVITDFKKQPDDVATSHKYENRFVYITSLLGLGWAFIVFLGLSAESFEYRIYTVLLLAALISVAVNIFSTSTKTLYFYLAPPILVSVPLLLMKGGNDSAIGIAVILFIVILYRSSKDVSKTLNDTLHLRSQTEILLENLKKLEEEKSSSEYRMQSVMDHSSAAIYVKDLAGRFTFLNEKVANLHGMKREEILGKTLYDILPKEIADVINKNDLEVIATGKQIECQESAPQHGEIRHYISNKFPLLSDKGEMYAVAGVSTDITDRVKIEDSLNISQQRLILHREQSPLGVIEWNTEFEFLDWNPAAEKIFGFTKEDVKGKHITKCILPESARDAVNDIWHQLVTNTGGTYSLNENLTKDGRIIMCEWHNTPLLDHDGKVIGVTSLVEDITERKTQEKALRQTQKMDAVGKLTGGIAHDFNNMLGVILGFSQLLRARLNKDDDKLVKYCDQIFHAGENAKKLTSKLLQFSRKDTASSEVTDINNLLEGMQYMLEKTLTARIELVIEMEDEICSVWLDKARLEDAILNVSINAMHAMPDGGKLNIKTKNISLGETNKINMDAGDYALLNISDTGTGMSEDVKAQVFEPFFTTKDDGGTGLGMSQVYGFVKQSGGIINIDSTFGEGTNIEIYLPKFKDVDNIDSEGTKVNINKDTELLNGNETILVVDDEISLLTLAKEILIKRGYTVFQAENAEQALEVLKKESIDLLFSDVIMPGMDGYQLADKVHKLYPHIKIQMTSGFTGEANKNITNIEYHNNRLPKPWNDKEMLGKVRELLDENKSI